MIKYIQTAKPSLAEGITAQVYAQIKRDFGRIVEPFMLHAVIPKLLTGAWMVCRETELVGTVPRNIKEVVAAAVSTLNQCPYCVDSHTIMLSASKDGDLANAISTTLYDKIADAKIRAIVDWALSTRSPGTKLLTSPPFSQKEAPEIIGTAVFYHYMNRMVSVMLDETPLPSNHPWLKAPLKQVATLMFSGAIRRPKNIGESLQFLPKASLPPDLCWAKTSSNIAHAYASFAVVINEVGTYALPEMVRATVEEEVREWDGATSELSLAWSEEAISQFDESTQSAARLALLTAFAPYRIDESIVTEFKQHFPEDDKLVGALAWASFTAARKIGTWLHA